MRPVVFNPDYEIIYVDLCEYYKNNIGWVEEGREDICNNCKDNVHFSPTGWEGL